ncbi:MAG: right-handed parallel beta-helix repeat-containing protein, partial [Candidatus Omnitrophica bacterium]|nr:right-handed parallel beta-helix repeat-containing protein [Candidatus Omnitrophota bacterium]
IIEYGGAGSNTANLYASGASPTIRHTTVRYSSARGMTATSSIPIVEDSLFADNATYGLYVGGFGSSPTRPILQRNTFNNNGSYPLHLEITNFPTTLANDTYTANGIQAIELVGSNPSADITILHDGLPYIVTSTININYSISNTLKTLTLQPGVTLKFAANTGLTTGAYGSNFPAALIAQGTSTQPITFTTSSATPAPGQWSGLAFYSGTTAATILDYCIIEYGGAGSNTANLYASGASPTIRHTTVRYSSAWGDASGPSGTGPGNGDGVSSSILYEPWLGTPFNNGFEWTSASDSPDPGPFLPSAGHTTFYGTLTEAGNWTVTVRNAINATVRILSGSGNSFAQDWVGDDASGQILPDGSYTYWMDSTSLSTGQSAAPAVGRISLDSTLPIADITAPTPDQMVNGAVNILGTAAGGSFSSYRLEYGPGPLPSAWTTIVFRTTAVTDGLATARQLLRLLRFGFSAFPISRVFQAYFLPTQMAGRTPRRFPLKQPTL